MTAIVLFKKALYGDRQRMNVGFNASTIKEIGPKVFTSTDGQFAWGRSAAIMQEDQREDTEKTVRELLTKALCDQREVKVADLTKSWLLDHDDPIPAVVMTHTRCFELLILDHNVIVRESSELSTGTGGALVLTSLHAGTTPKKAFQLAARFDGHTGCEYDVIQQKSLKPFTIR